MFNIWMTFTVLGLLALLYDLIVNYEARKYNAELTKRVTGDDSTSTKAIFITGLLCFIPILHWFMPFILLFSGRTKKLTEHDVLVLENFKEKYRNIDADNISPQEILDDINIILDMQK